MNLPSRVVMFNLDLPGPLARLEDDADNCVSVIKPFCIPITRKHSNKDK